jgi:hypothetical protein
MEVKPKAPFPTKSRRAFLVADWPSPLGTEGQNGSSPLKLLRFWSKLIFGFRANFGLKNPFKRRFFPPFYRKIL